MLCAGGKDDRRGCHRIPRTKMGDKKIVFFFKLNNGIIHKFGTELFCLPMHILGKFETAFWFHIAGVVFQMIDKKGLAAGGHLFNHKGL
jgi:hypothetical protein